MSLSANFPTIRPSLSLDFATAGSLDPRITFTRSTTAVYYDGVTTAKAEENLLTYSQVFNNTTGWTPSSAAVETVDAIAAPDGTITADLIREDTNTSPHYIWTTSILSFTSGLSYTNSVYVKKGNGATAPDYVQLTLPSAAFGTTQYANFNISSGTLGTYAACTPTITSVGNGWYRIAITGTASSTALSQIGALLFTNNNDGLGRVPTYAGVATSNVYLWGAQLEQRSSVTAYTATTTQPITTYIPVLQTAAANVARFDHNPTTGESLGLLIEEQRTNLLTYSEQFDNAAWTKQAVTIQANSVVAPDGTLTADTLVVDASSTTHQLYKVSVVASSTCAVSIYAKYAGVSTFTILDGTSAANGATFNLSTGVVTNVGSGIGSMIDVGNGWFRCVSVATTTGFRLYCPNSSSSATGNGYSGIYIWGAQLEAGAFPTSYIATTTASATRNADSVSMTGTNFSSWYNAGEGTLFINGLAMDSTTSISVALNNPTGSARITAFARKVGNNGTSGIIANDAGTTLLTGATYTGTSNDKAITAYGPNSFATTANAGSVTATTSGYMSAVTQMEIGRQTHLGSIVSGTIKKLAYYPERLTNAQLQALTS